MAKTQIGLIISVDRKTITTVQEDRPYKIISTFLHGSSMFFICKPFRKRTLVVFSVSNGVFVSHSKKTPVCAHATIEDDFALVF